MLASLSFSCFFWRSRARNMRGRLGLFRVSLLLLYRTYRVGLCVCNQTCYPCCHTAIERQVCCGSQRRAALFRLRDQGRGRPVSRLALPFILILVVASCIADRPELAELVP